MERELNTLTLYGWNADLFNEDSIHRHHGDALMIFNSSKKRFVSFKTFSQQKQLPRTTTTTTAPTTTIAIIKATEWIQRKKHQPHSSK